LNKPLNTHGGPRAHSGGRRPGAGRKAIVDHGDHLRLRVGMEGRNDKGKLLWSVIRTTRGRVLMIDAQDNEITISAAAREA
jgi:hypothetical protein